jgi:hypothetical protein
MQNKPNFQKSQMNVTSCLTMNYEQRTMNYEIKNKANSKPISKGKKPAFSLESIKINSQAKRIDGSAQIGKISRNVGFAHKGLCLLGDIGYEDSCFECTFDSSFVCDWLR